MRVGAVLLLAALLVAGCLSTKGRDDAAPDGAPAALAYTVDCSIGSPDWTEPCLAWASRNEARSKAEVDIAVNPTDPSNVFVASKDLDERASTCVWSVGQVTHDGGHSWQTVYVGGTRDQRGPTNPLFGWSCITDPILQYDTKGVLHYSLQAYDLLDVADAYPPGVPLPVAPEGGNMYQAISQDGGDTFPTIKLLHVGDAGAVYHDYMRMAVNPRTDTIFTLWNQITGGASVFPVVVAVDADGIVRPPVYFVSPGAPADLGLNAIAGAGDGTVHAVFTGIGFFGGSRADVYFAQSTDDGLTYTAPAKRFDFTPMPDLTDVQFRTGSSVEIAADTSGGEHDGCLYATYPDGKDDAGDILARTSCDGGATWSEPVLVSNGPHEGAQFFSRVSVDGHGTVHIVYLTQAYDPGHRLVDAEWAHSTDGGATWSVQRLTARSSDGDLGVHQDGFPFYGDYIGISSAGDHTYMGFPVTDTGRAELAVAHVRTSS